ncbi:MAG: hypothetical protein QF535_01165 [Anaerolineales bacterium]|nr:hypothetical protein [Anaerolineales bacterium]
MTIIESMRSEASSTYTQKQDLPDNPDNPDKHMKRQCAQRTGAILRFQHQNYSKTDSMRNLQL